MQIATDRKADDRARVLAAAAAARTRDRFDLVTSTVRASIEKSADGGADQLVLEAPASSTCIDLMGDKISLACLQSMQLQTAGMTTWLNHEYDIPEDVCGTIERAWIEEATDPKQGAVHDLWIRTLVDSDAERAVKSWQHIKNGRRFGFSIGGFITDWSFADLPNGDYVFVIEGLELFEISLVGIPANQRAVIDGVGKAATFSLEDRTAAPLAGAIRKRFESLDPAQRAAQRKALETRVLRGAEDDEPGLANVPEPPTHVAEPVAPAHVAEPVTPPAADPKPPAGKPGGLPAFNSIRLGVGALQLAVGALHLAIAADGERSVLSFYRDGNAHPIDVITVEGDRVIKAGKAISAATREALEGVQKHVQDAAAHGACPAVTQSIGNANDALTQILADGSDGDGAETSALRADLADRKAKLEVLDRDLAELDAARQKMVDENAWLIEFIATARTTSAGRATAPARETSYALGSTDPDARRRSTYSVLRELTSVLAGVDADDGRARSR